MLESDHGGIESIVVIHLTELLSWLESDHGGIESMCMDLSK